MHNEAAFTKPVTLGTSEQTPSSLTLLEPARFSVRFPSPDSRISVVSASETLNVPEVSKSTPRDFRFWGVFVSIAVSTFTSAMDLTAVSTALPVITNSLHGTEFVWVASAYALASTAFLPLSGGLAEVFGRRIVMLGGLFLFAVGSILCGIAPSMNFLIAGRTVQGLGAGGVLALSQIILSDLVSLEERGTFQAFIALAWAIASFIGPVIGGGLAQAGVWRWLFWKDLNIFTSVLSAILVILFLRLKKPEGTVREKLGKMDWIGNVMVIAASSSCIIALSWGGVHYPWSSPKVLIPLILGIFGLAGFLWYEAKYASYPIVPYSLMSTVTGLSGYLQTFINAIIIISVVYYLPVYFQACKGASPVQSGVDVFGVGFVLAPFNVITGITISRLKCYRPQLWIGWAVAMIGAGLLSTLRADSPKAMAIGFEAIVGISLGMLTGGSYFPVLSPIPISENAHALAFFTFLRNFGQVWGVTIGSTVLQNYLSKHLPPAFSSTLPGGTEIAYSVIPILGSLPSELRDEIRVAFAGGLALLWQVVIGIAGLGLLTSAIMKHVPLHSVTDEKWGVDANQRSKSSVDKV